MAFDGITTACLAHELSERLLDGRIVKIAQTESDELLLSIKPSPARGGGQVRLYLSANPSLPLVYLTDESRKVFDNAAPGSPESVRYSPADYENGTVDDGVTVTFRVITSEMYDENSVAILCNGDVVQKNSYGEFAVVADRDLVFSVQERDENNAPVLLKNHFIITLTSGGGSPTDKRANFPAPTIKITSLQTYPYTSGQKLYYY